MRREVPWREGLVTGAALGGALLGAAVLHALDLARLTRPSALLLALPLGAWFWWLHANGESGLGRVRGRVALALRLLMLLVLTAALAGPRAVRSAEGLGLIYVLDRSQSIAQENVNRAIDFMTRTVTQKPDRDEAGLVTFARDAAVELPPAPVFPFKDGFAIGLQRDGTDLAEGLSLAAAVLPPHKEGRLLLVSDGAQTEGAVRPVLDRLEAQNTAVDVLPIRYRHRNEVLVEHLRLPPDAAIGETQNAAVIVHAQSAGEGTLRLLESGRLVHERTVRYDKGKNRYEIPLQIEKAGYYDYEAVLQVPENRDGWQRNNRALASLHIEGKRRVLVIAERQNEETDPARAFVKALREGERAVEVRGPAALPDRAMAMQPFQAVVIMNVPRERFTAPQLEAVRRAVHEQGTGLLMTGGPRSFGPGGYQRTAMEKALPVRMDVKQRKVLPKSALAITLHTVEAPRGNTWAKRITKRAIKSLSPRDVVGALGYFRGNSQWIFPLTPAGQYPKLAPQIENARIGDMPAFAPTMRKAVQAFKKSDAATRHMIIISDGDPQPPPKALLQKFRKEKITVSAVTVFPHGQQTGTMKKIARVTGGRHYHPKKMDQLPAIFIKETRKLRRRMIQEKTFRPALAAPSPILKGIEALPPLDGFVLTSPKKRARTVLRPPEAPGPEPVLAVWRYGLGQAAAFTSGLGPRWGAQWVSWGRYRAFVQQLITQIARAGGGGALETRVVQEENRGVVLVRDQAEQRRLLSLRARVQPPRGATQQIRLRQTGPRRYEGTFPIRGEGRYRVSVRRANKKNEQRALAALTVPYAEEFRRLRANPRLMKSIAERTGGRTLGGQESADVIFRRTQPPSERTAPFFDVLLMLLAILVLLDVAVRRVQLDRAAVTGWFEAPRQPEAQTFSQLRQRKQSARQRKTGRGDQRAAETDTDTTGRLVAARRRRDGSSHEGDGS